METRNRKLEKTRTVFVTVGTTKFDRLIQTMCDENTVKCLKMLGYTEIQLQIGAGDFVPSITSLHGVNIEHFSFKPSIKQDIEQAELVISHAGAGSCLETLGAGKKLLVIINEELMGNHQLELAYQLARDGHLHYCTCGKLVETLKTKDFNNLKPFAAGKPELFAEFLDNMMGFS